MSGYKDLFYNQINTWQLASDNYLKLAGIITKEFYCDNQLLRVQFNPGRITSSTANVSTSFIKERPCFLCEKNRPEEQKGLELITDSLKNKYTILVNPFPVFPVHFTITGDHEAQHLGENFMDMLEIARVFDDCVVFYNGPKCGASAPDHMHFQAGNKGILPFTENIEAIISNSYQVFTSKYVSLFEFDECERCGWIIKSNDLIINSLVYKTIYENSKSGSSDIEEVMMNVLCIFDGDNWITTIFPRSKHRPDRYYSKNDDKLLISPASVEMGGLVICSKIEDFEKVSKEDLLSIYSEIGFCSIDVRSISLITKEILKNEI